MNLPAASVAPQDYDMLFSYLIQNPQENYIVINLVNSLDPWLPMWKGPVWVLFQVVGMSITLYIVGSALRKLFIFIFIIDGGIKFSVTQVSLVFQILASVIRVIFFVDPFGKHSIVLFSVARIVSSGTMMWNLMSLWMLIIYFQLLKLDMVQGGKQFWKSKWVRRSLFTLVISYFTFFLFHLLIE